ncbi:MAG: GNAT family N-acetyltransferase [Telluria sp.]
MIDASQDHDRSDVQAAWRQLLEAGHSPEKLYQLPEFFQYLVDMAKPGTPACNLHLVRRRSDAKIVALIPGRSATHKIGVRLGPLTLFERAVPVYQVLGSVLLLDAGEEGLSGFVLKSLLQRNPDCDALLMQAMPEELAGTTKHKGLSGHVMHGWRDCHTMPLAADVDTYLQKLSAKKRYNLSRQVRLLAKAAGEVKLVRIEQVDQVPALLDAMRTVLSDEEFAGQATQARLEGLARHGLLRSYMLCCGEQVVALVVGTCSNEVWHVHNISLKQEYMSLSVGTSIVHLALQDTIASGKFIHADFGYGTPNQEFRSTHVLQRRGKLLLCRRHGMANLLLSLHSVQDRLNEGLSGHVKAFRKWLKSSRRAAG